MCFLFPCLVQSIIGASHTSAMLTRIFLYRLLDHSYTKQVLENIFERWCHFLAKLKYLCSGYCVFFGMSNIEIEYFRWGRVIWFFNVLSLSVFIIKIHFWDQNQKVSCVICENIQRLITIFMRKKKIAHYRSNSIERQNQRRHWCFPVGAFLDLIRHV